MNLVTSQTGRLLDDHFRTELVLDEHPRLILPWSDVNSNNASKCVFNDMEKPGNERLFV